MNKETKTIYFKVFCTTIAPAYAEVPADLDPKEYQNYLNLGADIKKLYGID